MHNRLSLVKKKKKSNIFMAFAYFCHKMAVNWLGSILIPSKTRHGKKKTTKLAQIALLPKYCRFTLQNDLKH